MGAAGWHLATAGRFFPADPAALASNLAGLMAVAGDPGFPAAPRAIVVPHAGYRFCGAIAAAAWAAAAGVAWRRIVVLSPSHRMAFRGVALPEGTVCETPIGAVDIDPAGVSDCVRLGAKPLAGAFDAEHGVETQLPFIRHLFPGVPVLPLVVGEVGEQDLVRMIAPAWADPDTLVVISTDLSHFLTAESARRKDAETAVRMETAAWEAFGPAEACGWRALRACLSLADASGDRILRLAEGDSSAAGGPPDRVVGYGAWRIEAADEARLPERLCGDVIRLARRALASRLQKGKPPVIATRTFPPVLRTRAASFVTLTQEGRLRGCIGSLAPQRALAEDIAANAMAAALEDRRFRPVQQCEADGLKIKVSLLSPRVGMRFEDEEDLCAQLRPGRDGLILSDGDRRGVFLPMVWESLPDPAQFVSGLKVKAGLAKNHWSDRLTVERFTAETFEEAGRAAGDCD